jgi:hypothetical protein
MLEGNSEPLSTKRKNLLNYILEYPHRRKQIQGITNHQFQYLLAQAEMQY